MDCALISTGAADGVVDSGSPSPREIFLFFIPECAPISRGVVGVRGGAVRVDVRAASVIRVADVVCDDATPSSEIFFFFVVDAVVQVADGVRDCAVGDGVVDDNVRDGTLAESSLSSSEYSSMTDRNKLSWILLTLNYAACWWIVTL